MSTYNDELYVVQSVESILHQTYPYFELIVVNDGSTDRTLDRVKSVKDERIVVIDKINTGLPDSLNVGIKHSKYNWIVRMDADDVAKPDRLEMQVSLLSISIGVIGGQCDFINGNDEIIGCRLLPVSFSKIKRDLFWGNSPIVHPTAVINKKAIEEVGGYDTNFKAAQDIDLWYRISQSYRLLNVEYKVLNFRKHSNSISSSKADIQHRFALVAFAKYALHIQTVLSSKQFDSLSIFLEKRFKIKKIVTRVREAQTMPILKRKIRIAGYYLWRIYYYLIISFHKTAILRQIGL